MWLQGARGLISCIFVLRTSCYVVITYLCVYAWFDNEKASQLVRCIMFTNNAPSSVIQSHSRVCNHQPFIFCLNTYSETVVVQNSKFMFRMFGRLCTSMNIMRNHSLRAKLLAIPLLTIELDACWRWKIYSFDEVRNWVFYWPTCLILYLLDYFHHNQGLSLSLGAFRSSPVESLYVEAHEPPLEIRREKLALQYILKLKANPGNPAYYVVFNPKYQILYADKESATDSFGIHCKKLLKKAKIDVGEIAINSIPDVPIWDSEPVTVDFTLSEFDKSSTSSTVFKSRFNEV